MHPMPSSMLSRDLSIDELHSELRSVQAQLLRAQRLATVGTMAAMVAHEFNNILTPVLSYAGLAAGGDEEMRDKAIHHAYDGAARAGDICRALLDFARDDGEEIEEILLTRVVAETLATMARHPTTDGIRLIQRIPAKLAVRTRRNELKQVLLNLLLNARDAALAAGEDKSISISASRGERCVQIKVADTGVGIAPEHLQRIFEPFYTTKAAAGGSGLGLAVCRRIAGSLGGELVARSQVGKGSSFTLHLPMKPPAIVPPRPEGQ